MAKCSIKLVNRVRRKPKKNHVTTVRKNSYLWFFSFPKRFLSCGILFTLLSLLQLFLVFFESVLKEEKCVTNTLTHVWECRWRRTLEKRNQKHVRLVETSFRMLLIWRKNMLEKLYDFKKYNMVLNNFILFFLFSMHKLCKQTKFKKIL